MEWLQHPLKFVDEYFESKKDTAQWKECLFEHFKSFLQDYSKIRNSIPSLNDIPLHKLQDGCVVRFRCTIQDMFNPELYFGAYELKHEESGQTKKMCGLFRDAITHDHGFSLNSDTPDKNCSERLVYHCTSIPGENQWVKNQYKEQCQALFGTETTACSSNSNKRTLDSESMDTDCLPSVSDQNKKNKLTHGVGSDEANNSSFSVDAYLAWPDKQAVTAIVKVYEPSNYSLNDVVEFVGILSVDPQISNKDDTSADEIPMREYDDSWHLPPSSLVPRLHVLRGFQMAHNNPLLPLEIDNYGDLDMMLSLCKEVRSQLHWKLERMLGGDSLAADYLICHLISSTMKLHNDAQTVGKCCLNFTNVSRLGDDFVARFYRLLSSLVTKSVLLPLSLENLNSCDFVPTKDYSVNRLKSGRLQLSSRTHLIIDETVLTEGQLIHKGVVNVAALNALIQHQQVDYDFKYSKTVFKAEIPVLILSEKKSILTTNYVVPLVEAGSSNDSDKHFQEIESQLRTYLSVLRFVDYNHKFSSDLEKSITEFFVEERQKDVTKMTEDIFHNILSLSKLLSLSYGERELSAATWEKTKLMELERSFRF